MHEQRNNRATERVFPWDSHGVTRSLLLLNHSNPHPRRMATRRTCAGTQPGTRCIYSSRRVGLSVALSVTEKVPQFHTGVPHGRIRAPSRCTQFLDRGWPPKLAAHGQVLPLAPTSLRTSLSSSSISSPATPATAITANPPPPPRTLDPAYYTIFSTPLRHHNPSTRPTRTSIVSSFPPPDPTDAREHPFHRNDSNTNSARPMIPLFGYNTDLFCHQSTQSCDSSSARPVKGHTSRSTFVGLLITLPID